MKKFFLIFMTIFFSGAMVFSQDLGLPEDTPVESEDEFLTDEDAAEKSEEALVEPENGSESEDAEENIVQKKEPFNPFSSTYNQVGDQFIKISLMGVFPLNFGGEFPLYREGQIATGGAGELGYHRFLTSWLAVGVDIAFGYNPTLEKNMFTWVPLFINATIQPTIWRFEIPITIAVGAAYETHVKKNYFPGFVFKPELGVYFRVSPGWSFGLETQFMIMPQTFDNSDYNFTGYFQTFGISARYHF